ncbi:class I SAM-dependent methyltransferase [Bosea sp. (in: a-proteobacteria)]|uniref:class I SAM-dependent methyltransferase n=1 Tax=Bosea sp. (in: a-proteobacteria) TaxID=1871050 RepID=UPI0025BC260F|nr:class I SAM-dependent methyltransferase [Bosea sp. (in: a-proteobacteria)]
MVADYVAATPRKVPGFADLHRMAMLLLAEGAPAAADILVVGAGGGLELRAFAEARPGWHFVGVDPSAEMIDLARRVLGPLGTRVDLRQGYIESVPPGPSDGATCLLTLHFLQREERLHTLREIRRRLKPGAPLVVAHHSCPSGDEPTAWLARSAAFADGPGADVARARLSAAKMAEHLPLLSADQDVAVQREAGFSDVALFYAGFSFRGWVSRA